MPPKSYNLTGPKKWQQKLNVEKKNSSQVCTLICNRTLRVCQNTWAYISTKPSGAEVWGLDWFSLLFPSYLSTEMTFKHSSISWQDYGVIMNRAAPNTGNVCLAKCKHDLTGNRPTRTHKHMWVQRFSGPPVYRAAGSSSGLPSHLLCWHAGYQCLFQRKLWLLLRLPGKWAPLSLASVTGLLLHAASDMKGSLAISYNQEV